MSIVIGLDPGTQKAGFAVIEFHAANQFQILEYGTWKLMSARKETLAERLEMMFESAQKLFRKYNPQVMGVEYAVVHKSPLASLKVAEARGVLRLAAQQILADLESRWFDLSPTQVKKLSTGLGSSSKESVERGMRLRMRMSQTTQEANAATYVTADSFDAMAIAFAAYRLSRKKHLIALDSQAKSR